VLILIALAALTIALAFIPGVGIIAVVPAFIAVAYLAWLAFAFLSGSTPGRAVRETPPGPDLESGSSSNPDLDR
jgi:hypothetical protein